MKNLMLLTVIMLLAVGCAKGPAGDDGKNGTDGLPGQDSIIEVINPCNDSPGYDEVILRLASGQLVVYFEQSNNRFLTELSPGIYQTTDSQRCVFIVDENLNVTF